MDQQNKGKMTNLPSHFVDGLNRTVNDNIDGKSPIETIMEQRGKGSKPAPLPAQPTKTNSYALKGKLDINGYTLPVFEDEFQNAVTMINFILATELSKNPGVNRLLKKFHFKFPDINGKIIYPRSERKRKKKCSKNARLK